MWERILFQLLQLALAWFRRDQERKVVKSYKKYVKSANAYDLAKVDLCKAKVKKCNAIKKAMDQLK